MPASPKTTPKQTHVARKSSPASWKGLITPLSADEAIIWGPVYKYDLTEFGENITLAFAGRPAQIARVEVRLHLRKGRCVLIETTIINGFWKRPLVFRFPPMKASEVVERIWNAITTAQTRPNVDPVSFARESLPHGRFPEHSNPDSETFVYLAAWHEE